MVKLITSLSVFAIIMMASCHSNTSTDEELTNVIGSNSLENDASTGDTVINGHARCNTSFFFAFPLSADDANQIGYKSGIEPDMSAVGPFSIGVKNDTAYVVDRVHSKIWGVDLIQGLLFSSKSLEVANRNIGLIDVLATDSVVYVTNSWGKVYRFNRALTAFSIIDTEVGDNRLYFCEKLSDTVKVYSALSREVVGIVGDTINTSKISPEAIKQLFTDQPSVLDERIRNIVILRNDTLELDYPFQVFAGYEIFSKASYDQNTFIDMQISNDDDSIYFRGCKFAEPRDEVNH